MLSQTAEYALRAVLLIAAGEGQPVGAGRLAGELGVPPNYLSKTLHQLSRAGVLDSTRGRLGGFRLARPAGRITLLEVVRPFDPIPAGRACLLGLPVCSDRTACPAHRKWKRVAEQVADFFSRTTVADLAPGRG